MPSWLDAQSVPEGLDGIAEPPTAKERADEESQRIQNAIGRVTKLFNEEFGKLDRPWLKQHNRQDWGSQAVSSFTTAMKNLKSAKPKIRLPQVQRNRLQNVPAFRAGAPATPIRAISTWHPT